MNWLKAQWAALPHGFQAAIITVASAFIATFIHAAEESGCYTGSCLKHYAGTAVGAALVAVRTFYMLPNKPAEAEIKTGANP